MTDYRVAKYKAGDRIYVTNGVGTGCYGVIKEARNSYDAPVYDVLLDGEDSYRTYDEGNLQFESLLDEPIDFEPRKNHPKPHNDLLDTEIEEYVSNENDKQESESYEESNLMNIEIEDIYPSNPKFKVGDVVNVAGHPDTLYVVNEALLVEDETTVHLYDVSPIYDTNQDSLTCEGALLTFQYHDTQWAEYFTEGTYRGNGLAQWRGKVYDFYIFYGDVTTHGDLNEELMKEYWDCTIPPEFMEHILDSHSVWDRIDSVFESSSNKQKLMSMFNMDNKKLKDLRSHIRKKINLNNMNESHLRRHGKALTKEKYWKFTDEEDEFIDEVLKLDTTKDHYPRYMTYFQIMSAIKDAYDNAHKTNDPIRMQPSLDKRTGESRQPVKGQRVYRGESKRYGLHIEFWYDFDLKVIASAYPLDTHIND